MVGSSRGPNRRSTRRSSVPCARCIRCVQEGVDFVLPSTKNLKKNLEFGIVAKIKLSPDEKNEPIATGIYVYLGRKLLVATEKEKEATDAIDSVPKAARGSCAICFKHKLMPSMFPDLNSIATVIRGGNRVVAFCHAAGLAGASTSMPRRFIYKVSTLTRYLPPGSHAMRWRTHQRQWTG